MSSLGQVVAIKALDGLHLRAIAIAENVANGGSAWFQPKAVDFEAELRRAATDGMRAVLDFQPQLRPEGPIVSGDEVRLDLQMASASETALRYAALTDVLNRQLQISRLAVRGQ